MKKMKCLVKAKAEVGLWMDERPIPQPGPSDLLIQINQTAICGTDVHIYNWDAWSQKTIPIPMITGHEFVGVVAEVGNAVRGYQVGDRVSGEGHIICGVCRNCRAGQRHLCRNTVGVGVHRDGCFAEYLVIPAENAFKIPDSIPDEMASIFDPLGNATHTALSFDLVGEDVLITGAGPIGVMAIAIAKWAGARHIIATDINPYRLELAKKMGATRVLDPRQDDLRSAMKDLGMTEGFDVGLEMSGNGDAFRSMLDTMNHGGKVAMLGIFPDQVAVDWSQIIFKGLQLQGVYGRKMYETWYKMTSMIQSGLDLSSVITHRFSVDQFEEGFQTMRSGHSGKVILNWNKLS